MLFRSDSPGKNTGVDCHFLLQVYLPDPGIEPMSLMSPALAGEFFTASTNSITTREVIISNVRYELKGAQPTWYIREFLNFKSL